MTKEKFQQMRERVKDFRPIDDAFFEVLIKDERLCEEILRTILGDKNLKVLYTIPQSSIRNLYGRSIRGDMTCVLGDGTECNIEVQKADNDNHVKRVRYNASCITANTMDVGEKFENVPTLYVIYISEFDFWEDGETIYHVHKVVEETGREIDDGLHEIFVNTKVNDGTEIAELMKCFLQKEINDDKFPELERNVKYYKEDKEGIKYMCEIMERERREGRAEGEARGRINSIMKFLSKPNGTEEGAKEMLDATDEEIAEAKERLLEMAMNKR